MTTTAKTKDGTLITFNSQENIPWKHAKRLMGMANGATAEDLEFAIAVMITSWGYKTQAPTVNKDGTVNSNGLDDLSAGQVNEIANLIAESNNNQVGK